MKSQYEKIISNSYLDCDNELISFPIFNSMQQLVGYQQYNYKETDKKLNNSNYGRYYSYTTQHNVPYGLQFYDASKPIAVCEGVFDCISLLECSNYNSFALLSKCNTEMNKTIALYPGEKILVSDGDVLTLTEHLIFNSKLQRYSYIDTFCYNSFVICPHNTDPNTLSKYQLMKLLDNRQHFPHYFTQQTLNNAIEFFNKLL
jgi:hypothetical protein